MLLEMTAEMATVEPVEYVSRRSFLRKAAVSAKACLTWGTLGNSSSWGSTVPDDRTLRDRLWMWGHDAGSLTAEFGIGGKDSDIEPADALEYMGIPNICVVRFTGTPLPPFDDFVKQFANTKRFTWSIVDGAKNFTTEEKKRQALDLAAKHPNLVGLDLDDFFLSDGAPQSAGQEAHAHLTVAQLRELRQELVVEGRKLDLSMVVYSKQLKPMIKQHIDLVDAVYFWTWRASELINLEANFAKYRQIVPDKRTLLGIYMWNFGEKKTIPVALMEHQCRLALEWIKQGKIEGLIFHCTPLCGMKLEAVEWSRAWIARHADEIIGE